MGTFADCNQPIVGPWENKTFGIIAFLYFKLPKRSSPKESNTVLVGRVWCEDTQTCGMREPWAWRNSILGDTAVCRGNYARLVTAFYLRRVTCGSHVYVATDALNWHSGDQNICVANTQLSVTKPRSRCSLLIFESGEEAKKMMQIYPFVDIKCQLRTVPLSLQM